MLLLRDYGTVRLADVLAPAIAYARNGYPLVERISATIEMVEQLFREHWPTSAAVYLPGGEVPEPGTLFPNPALADTYARILREAESAGGDRERADRTRAQSLVAGLRRRGDRPLLPHAGGDGRLRPAASRRADRPRHGAAGRRASRRRSPTTMAATRVLKAGPWSQGPVTLQQLALLKGFDLDRLDPAGPDFIHLQVECAKLAFADRDTFYGDPDFVEVPVATLLSDAYNDERRKLYRSKASLELRPGSIAKASARVGRRLAAGAGRTSEPAVERARAPASRPSGRMGDVRGDTVHFDIIDQAGNMVVVDAVGRLAAILAGDPGARLLPRHAGADVLARRGPSGRARAGQAAAHDAVADPGAARRRALSRLGHARRRPAGPVDHAVLPAPCPCRHEPAAGDRRAGLAHRAFPDPRSGRAPRAPACWWSRAACRRRRSRNCSGAAISSRSAPTGRRAGSPPPPATASAAAPPPIRAACRATRSDDKDIRAR